jgi:hypothetical protein
MAKVALVEIVRQLEEQRYHLPSISLSFMDESNGTQLNPRRLSRPFA